MANLVFGKSFSIESFKSEQGASVIEVIKSPKSGNYFFTCDGKVAGAVSEKAIGADKAEISITEVTGDNGEFLLMHKRSTSNVVATF